LWKSEGEGSNEERRDELMISDAFDIDGNGWSSRFHRLIMSGSVVLKSTIYPEWISVCYHISHCSKGEELIDRIG
jgi:hypothetical protein